jgi:hypothetical protein
MTILWRKETGVKSIWIVLVSSLLLATSIQAQAPDPVGEQFQVNSYTTNSQKEPAVAATPQGNFVVVWRRDGSVGTDTSSYSIQGQRYSSGIVFADGFESGDMSAWSSTVP